jgi:REP element-mobilizing transposase RayT
MYSKQHPDFITITCLNWKYLLKEDCLKDVIIESLNYLASKKIVAVYAFVIMPNHMHMIWQMNGDHKREDVQRNFLKFTGQHILKHFRNTNTKLLAELLVNAKDRKYQVWERNSLSIPLWSHSVLWQKLNYIHQNPVVAGLCERDIEYKYSSARFYKLNDPSWSFLEGV